MSSVLRIRLSATFWILQRLIKYVTSLATLMQNELACAISITPPTETCSTRLCIVLIDWLGQRIVARA
jgi:hypothetical protein